MKRVVIDIETNGLLEDMIDYSQPYPLKLKDTARLWCITLRDFDNWDIKHTLSLEDCTKDNLRSLLSEAKEIIFHNGLNFDMPALQLFGVIDYTVGFPGTSDTCFGKDVKYIDTLLLSQFLKPDRLGGHSAKAWGRYLGNAKIDFHEFHQYSEEMLHYCITPDMRLLDTNLYWRPASEFKVGDVILGFDEEIQEGRQGRRYKNSTIEIINEDYQEVFEVTLESGKTLKVTKEHRFLVSKSNHGCNSYTWMETKDLKSKVDHPDNYSSLPCLLPVYEQENTYDSGWLGGMFDGEGCLIVRDYKAPPGVTISQRPTATLDKLEHILSTFDIKMSKRHSSKYSDCMTLKVSGGLSEVYRALAICRPERLIKRLNFDSFGRLELRDRSYNDPVVSVKSVGIHKILKIQTSTSTFMCEGYPMHNCEQDTLVQCGIYKALLEELVHPDELYRELLSPFSMESKLVDLVMRQELRGFKFDVPHAESTLAKFIALLDELQSKIDPELPPRPLNKGEQAYYTPTAKQIKKNGEPTAHMFNFATKIGAELRDDGDDGWTMIYEKVEYKLPYTECVKTQLPGSIHNLDYLKGYLLDLGWDPLEWKERDLTQDSKKFKLSDVKKEEAIHRYVTNTLDGPYKEYRLSIIGVKEGQLLTYLLSKKDERVLKVPTGPCLRVGTEKALCPNLEALGEEAKFVTHVVEYLTFKHRKSSLAGGVEDEDGEPTKGFLAYVREDGRISTPAATCGANGK